MTSPAFESRGARPTFKPPVPRLVCLNPECLTVRPVLAMEEEARGCPNCGSYFRVTGFYNLPPKDLA